MNPNALLSVAERVALLKALEGSSRSSLMVSAGRSPLALEANPCSGDCKLISEGSRGEAVV